MTDDWFISYSGRRLHILAPRPEDIVIEDIAHALANICRFGGHVRQFYSVAEHGVMVSSIVGQDWFTDPSLALQGLLHDASEAYLGDVIRPLKIQLPAYKDIEKLWERAISEKFELPFPLDPEVKRADMVALVTERRDLISVLTERDGKWLEDQLVQASPEHGCGCWPPELAELRFMSRFDQLMRQLA